MFKTIRAKLYVAVFMLAGVAIVVGVLGLIDLKESNQRFTSVYDNRIVPLRQLKSISDFYAINVVDTVHKAADGSISLNDANKLIKVARDEIKKNWEAYASTELTKDESALADKAKKLFAPANQLMEELLTLTEKGNKFELQEIAKEVLYEKIDPITSVIAELVELQLVEANKNNLEGVAQYESVRNIFIIVLVLGIGLAVVLAGLIVSSIVKTIETLKTSMNEIAQEKDLSHQVPQTSQDELGELAVAFNGLMQAVCGAIDRAKKTSMENSAVAEELSTTSMQIGVLAEKSAGEVEETTKMAEAVSSILETSEKGATKSGSVITGVANEVSGAAHEVLSVSTDLQTIVQNQSDLTARLERLNEEADQVKQVLSVIADIAEQTNLLALNAAIEAARAGAHGRGFAVVADEVRKLAERTQKSLTESNATVMVIIQSVNTAADMMKKSSSQIQSLGDRAEDTEELMRKTVKNMDHAKEIALQSAEDAREGKNHTTQVIDRVRKINEITTTNARSVEEIAGAAEHLAKLSDELSTALNEFRTH